MPDENEQKAKKTADSSGPSEPVGSDIFTIENGVLCGYSGPGGAVLIPQGVTEIGTWAFCGRDDMTHVTIPQGVTEIADYSFRNCPGLQAAELPAGLRIIGECAFAGCSGLRELHIPEGVTTIKSEAFAECTGLQLVTLPDSLSEIGARAFRYCRCRIVIRRWIPSLDDGLSWSDRVRICTDDQPDRIPEQYRFAALLDYAANGRYDDGSERSRSYRSYARRNAREMVEKAFKYPELLRFLCACDLIPPGTIRDYMDEAERRGSTLQWAMLLSSIDRIGRERIERAQISREEAEAVSRTEHNARLALLDTGVDIAGLHFFLPGRHPAYWEAERKWLERHSAVVDRKITRRTDFVVGPSEIDVLYAGEPKYPCPEANRGSTVTISRDAFRRLIGWDFSGCSDKTVVIPAWLKEIAPETFKSFRMETVTLPDSIEKIGSEAFAGCKWLETVVFPKRLSFIGEEAFRDCENLETVAFPEGLRSIGDRAFQNCFGLMKVVFPEGLASIDSCAFHGCRGLTSIELPESLSELGEGAFLQCRSLSEVKFRPGLKVIGERTFRGCVSLRTVELPPGLVSIGRRAFNRCLGLTELTLPDSVESLGGGAFADCRELRELRLSARTTWTDDPFGGCRSLTLCAPAGSFAESWARDHGFPFRRTE